MSATRPRDVLEALATLGGIAALVVAGLWLQQSCGSDSRESKRAAEQDARTKYVVSVLAGRTDRPDLRAAFVRACRRCASPDRCEKEARELDVRPEVAVRWTSCP